jgi:hypothetical protein
MSLESVYIVGRIIWCSNEYTENPETNKTSPIRDNT